MRRARQLYGNGEALTSRELDEDMWAPDVKLLNVAYPYLYKEHRDFLAAAANRGFFGGKE